MRNFYFILLFFVSFFSYSQKELNLDNNLTFSTLQADNVTRNIGFNFVGDNTLILKKFDINSNTNYSYLTDRQDELLQRISFTYRVSKNNLNTYSFLTYQFNSSLIRKIETDHWLGLGYGIKGKIKNVNLSGSYAVIFQDIIWDYGDTRTYYRHSLRGKVKFTSDNFEVFSEYFYQPNMNNFDDYMIIGTSKFVIMPKNKLNFVIQDIINYNSITEVKLLHTISLGIQYKLNKKF